MANHEANGNSNRLRSGDIGHTSIGHSGSRIAHPRASAKNVRKYLRLMPGILLCTTIAFVVLPVALKGGL